MSRDGDVRGARVPMLLVQPIVENALKHGAAGPIEIAIRREGPSLVIDVSDGGPGAAEDALRGRAGIGLGNTRERLATLYGSSASLDLRNQPDAGARVRVSLPFA